MATGLISTANFPDDLAALSYAGGITRLMPNGSAPLLGLTGLLQKKKAMNIQHGYFSKKMIFPVATLSAAIADGAATNFPVVAATSDHLSHSNLIAGDLLRAESTEEVVMVSAVTANALTVIRGMGSVAPAAIASGVKLYHIGNAFPQGSTRPNSVRIIEVPQQNYTQIFRNSWAVTKTAAAIPMIAGAGQVAESKQDGMMLHAIAQEKALIFGQKKLTTGSNGQPLSLMDGVLARVKADAAGNITNFNNAGTNWTQMEAALDKVLNVQTDPKNGNSRIGLVGGVFLRTVNNICRLNSEITLTTTQSSWGMKIRILETPRGTFEFIEHPLFNAYGNSSPWAAMGVILDLGAISVPELRPTEDLEYNMNGTPVDSGIDAVGGTLTTELTMELTNPEACGLITGLSVAAAG